MTMIQSIGAASDRVMAALKAELEVEYGAGAGEALAQRFLEAEECDFLWDARQSERWIGAYESEDDDDFGLERIAIVGRLDGRWFVATCIVDGDGAPRGLIGRRSFASERLAREGFAKAH